MNATLLHPTPAPPHHGPHLSPGTRRFLFDSAAVSLAIALILSLLLSTSSVPVLGGLGSGVRAGLSWAAAQITASEDHSETQLTQMFVPPCASHHAGRRPLTF